MLSLIPMVVLGFVLARVLQAQVRGRTLAEETRAARLIARIGIQPRLSPREVQDGVSPAGIRELDRQLQAEAVKHDLARIKLWNARDTVIYSDDHTLIGRTLEPSDDLEAALDGHPEEATIVNPSSDSETAGEVGLGTLIEVYVPLRFSAQGRPAGAFEMYLSYKPVAGAIARDHKEIAMLIAGGLLLLWLVLFRIVAGASRRLRQQARENDRLARYDQLTGLANRTLYMERLDAMLSAGHPPGPGAVLIADIEGFKQINNTFGSDAGDELLCAVGRRLEHDLGDVSLVARVGNDEFALLSCPLPEGGAASVAEALQRALEPPVVLDGVGVNVEVSIGIARIGGGNNDAQELIRHAEAALGRARVTGSSVEEYSPERDHFDPERLSLLGQVRGALENGEFILHYQPKLDLKTRRVTGAEALVRWQHPEKGLLAPVDFVTTVEQTALISPLTSNIVRQAVRDLARWRADDLELDVSINLSARNLLDAALPAQVLEIASRHDVDPGWVTIEVTESATLTDPDAAVAVLQELRAAGFGVSIDDYGTGNASIDYLARLPASEIKIDRSFVSDICTDPRADAVVRSTINLARHLELEVVAEGIETREVLDHLSALGCDCAQGYLISRPVPFAELAGRVVELHETLAAAPAAVEISVRRTSRATPAV
ncbi:MAG TPA: bifunctional diguanylate cyclase/phosphodiesterase [Solirubrobacteraceae bacterium]|nr:bifunctional diguanylate cyclase/phosphodiesterase [Solirubrobacteraceae bacterium]